DDILVEKMNRKKQKTMREIEDIWYEGYSESRSRHYHNSRYHFLNLHSFFRRNRTVELRGFNSVIQEGKIRSYIVLSLAINNQQQRKNKNLKIYNLKMNQQDINNEKN